MTAGGQESGCGLALRYPAIIRAVIAFIVLANFIALPGAASVFTADPGQGTAALQSIIDAAGAGDTVLLRPGTYRTAVIINKPLVIRARDPADIPEIATGVRDAGIIITAKGCVIADILVTGNAKNGILIQSDGNIVSGVKITDLERGISLDRADSNIIVRNTLVNNRAGIVVEPGSRNNSMYLNYFDNTIDAVVRSKDNFWDSLPTKYRYNGRTFTGQLGNYWVKHSGADANQDGVTDLTYHIPSPVTGLAGFTFTDNTPLAKSPDQYAIPLQFVPPLPADASVTTTRPPDAAPDTSQNIPARSGAWLLNILYRSWWALSLFIHGTSPRLRPQGMYRSHRPLNRNFPARNISAKAVLPGCTAGATRQPAALLPSRSLSGLMR